MEYSRVYSRCEEGRNDSISKPENMASGGMKIIVVVFVLWKGLLMNFVLVFVVVVDFVASEKL